MELCKTDLQQLERLLRQCSVNIEKYAPKTSPAQDLCRRCNKFIKKLNKKKK